MFGVPGISSPPDRAHRGQILRDLAPWGQIPWGLRPPCAPSFRDLAPPPPNDTVQKIFLYLDLVTKKASEIWFGNLFGNGFAQVRLRANVVQHFLLPSYHIRDYSLADASLILLRLFYIANIIDCLVGDTSLRLIYIH